MCLVWVCICVWGSLQKPEAFGSTWSCWWLWTTGMGCMGLIDCGSSERAIHAFHCSAISVSLVCFFPWSSGFFGVCLFFMVLSALWKSRIHRDLWILSWFLEYIPLWVNTHPEVLEMWGWATSVHLHCDCYQLTHCQRVTFNTQHVVSSGH